MKNERSVTHSLFLRRKTKKALYILGDTLVNIGVALTREGSTVEATYMCRIFLRQKSRGNVGHYVLEILSRNVLS